MEIKLDDTLLVNNIELLSCLHDIIHNSVDAEQVAGTESITYNAVFGNALNSLKSMLGSTSNWIRNLTTKQPTSIMMAYPSGDMLKQSYASLVNTLIPVPPGLSTTYRDYVEDLLVCVKMVGDINQNVFLPFEMLLGKIVNSKDALVSSIATDISHIPVYDTKHALKELAVNTQNHTKANAMYGKVLRANSDWGIVETHVKAMEAIYKTHNHTSVMATLTSCDTLLQKLINVLSAPENAGKFSPEAIKNLASVTFRIAEYSTFYAYIIGQTNLLNTAIKACSELSFKK